MIDALEGQNTIAQILELSFFIEERALDCHKRLAWVFAKNMVQEVCAVSKYSRPFKGQDNPLKASKTPSPIEIRP